MLIIMVSTKLSDNVLLYTCSALLKIVLCHLQVYMAAIFLMKDIRCKLTFIYVSKSIIQHIPKFSLSNGTEQTLDTLNTYLVFINALNI